jgi:hypothetical protein
VYNEVAKCEELNLGLFKMLAKYQGAVNAYPSTVPSVICFDLFDFGFLLS